MHFLSIIFTLLLSTPIQLVVKKDLNLVKTKVLIQTPKQIGYDETLKLFLKAERKLMQHRKKLEKSRKFSDPPAEYDIWLSTFKKESPELLEHTSRYTASLLQILQNNPIHKDEYSNEDIIKLFYALCIDEYTDVVEDVLTLYKAKKVDEEVFKFAITQDCFFSNLVISNYQNPKLKLLLNKILKEIQARPIKSKVNLVEEIKAIISGKAWNECKYEYTSFQPVILKSKNCQ